MSICALVWRDLSHLLIQCLAFNKQTVLLASGMGLYILTVKYIFFFPEDIP